MNKIYHKSSLVISISLLAAIAGMITGCINERIGASQPPRLQAATSFLEQAKPLPTFSLVDDAGKPFNNERLAGQWHFMFFGYTHCPDICPTTLSILNAAMRSVPEQEGADGMKVVFVSVDPQRDTIDTLKKYVDYFNPAFVAVTGKQGALNNLTDALGILHTRTPNANSEGAYLVDHSASILLIDPEGKLVALFSPPHKAQWLASDFLKLRRYYERS
jgi:protein SCO1/2